MDWGRRAYSTDCLFFENSDRVNRVQWEEAAPGALAIEYPSCILSKQQEPDDWLPGGIGEVADAPRVTTLARAPRGMGRGHVCGTPEEFAEGGTYDPALPPERIGALGWPLCCDPPKRLRLGAGAGVRSAVTVTAPRVTVGAGAGVRSTYTVEAAVAPGLTCATAPDIALGVTYPGHLPGAGVDHWYRVPAPPVDVYRLVWDTSGAPGVRVRVVAGSCAESVVWFFGLGINGCTDSSIVPPAGPLWVHLDADAAVDYTFVLSTGQCL